MNVGENYFILIAGMGVCLIACEPAVEREVAPPPPVIERVEEQPEVVEETVRVVPIQNGMPTVADYLACLRNEDVMMISAHRGGPAPGFPENAIETFEEALSVGPMFIETDVRLTADRVMVLLHDDDLARTTTGEGLLAETTFASLQDVRLLDNSGAVTSYGIPTLEEALDWARERTILQLDVKRGTPIDAVVDAVAAAGALSYAVVIAYTMEDALRAAAADPEITVSIQILDVNRLDRLEQGGLSANRVMAWTGTEFERPELWQALNQREVSAAWGSLWHLDRAVEETGDDSQFARLAEEGLDILSSDLHVRAFDAVDERQDTNGAVARCNY